jgi:hypothetical protein
VYLYAGIADTVKLHSWLDSNLEWLAEQRVPLLEASVSVCVCVCVCVCARVYVCVCVCVCV